MIAYEIQLRYVIRDKIQSETKFSLNQSETKFSLRQNSVQDKIQSQTKSEIFFFRQNFLCQEKIIYQKKKICWKKFSFCLGLNFVSDFQCAFLSCFGQIDAYYH